MLLIPTNQLQNRGLHEQVLLVLNIPVFHKKILYHFQVHLHHLYLDQNQLIRHDLFDNFEKNLKKNKNELKKENKKRKKIKNELSVFFQKIMKLILH